MYTNTYLERLTPSLPYQGRIIKLGQKKEEKNIPSKPKALSLIANISTKTYA